MRYVILGAGAVGGAIGGLLHRAGRDVVLLARGEHARALARDGLTLARPDGRLVLRIPVATTVPDHGLGDGDVLVTATKTQHTEALLDEVAAVRTDLPVVCAQNGVENERLALRRFPDVYGICVMLPATHLRPGVVVAEGAPRPGILDIGRYPAGVDAFACAVADDLAAAGFLSVPRSDVMRWKYTKLVWNLGNALEVLCGPGRDDADVRALRRRAVDEGRQVLRAAGVEVLADEEWLDYRSGELALAPVEGEERGGGSTWQSVMRGTGSVEVDFLNGEIALLGRLHGVPSPVNTLLQQESTALVRDGRPAGSVPAADLLRRLDQA